jgi:hypothetical protein
VNISLNKPVGLIRVFADVIRHFSGLFCFGFLEFISGSFKLSAYSKTCERQKEFVIFQITNTLMPNRNYGNRFLNIQYFEL